MPETSEANTLEKIRRDIANQMLELLSPARLLEGPGRPVRGKYSHVTHIKLCKLKMLGLSDATAARAIGISPQTLRDWIHRDPVLGEDLEQAESLANANAALILRSMMEGDDQRAYQAVKFFLETHAPEFARNTTVTVRADLSGLSELVREQIYGIDTAELREVDSEPLDAKTLPPPPPPSEDLELSDAAEVAEPGQSERKERPRPTPPDL